MAIFKFELVLVAFLGFSPSIIINSEDSKPSSSDSFLQCFSNHLQNSNHSNVTSHDSDIISTQNTCQFMNSMSKYSRHIGELGFRKSSIPKPEAIITPLYEYQVQAAVVCSRENGLRVIVRGLELFNVSDSVAPYVVIDLANFRSICVDFKNRNAWIESGGISLRDLFCKIAEKCMALHGSSEGYGSCRLLGFQALLEKHVQSLHDVVDAKIIDIRNGRIIYRESIGEEAFTAILGGQRSSYGVVLSWRIRLDPLLLVDICEAVARSAS